MTIRAFLLVLALLGTAWPASAAEQMWYAQAISDSPTGVQVTYFWSRGSSLRALTILQGRPIVTLVHRDWYYVVDEISGKGIAVQRSTQALREDAEGHRPFGQEAVLILEQGAEKVGTESLGGETLDVWRLTDDKSRREVWTTPDRPDIPLMVEVFDRATSAQHKIRYVDWEWTLELPERFFRPDARIVLERMSYDEYLRRTADLPPALPVLYSRLLHGRERLDE